MYSNKKSHIMRSYYVDLCESQIGFDYYETILSKFPEWKSINRELKIDYLFDVKKIQLDIGEIKSFSSSVFGSFEEEDVVPLSKGCFVIKSMSFTIKTGKVEKLRIDIEILTTYYGNLLKNMIDDGIDIQINQKINNNQVVGFYVKNRLKLVA